MRVQTFSVLIHQWTQFALEIWIRRNVFMLQPNMICQILFMFIWQVTILFLSWVNIFCMALKTNLGWECLFTNFPFMEDCCIWTCTLLWYSFACFDWNTKWQSSHSNRSFLLWLSSICSLNNVWLLLLLITIWTNSMDFFSNSYSNYYIGLV